VQELVLAGGDNVQRCIRNIIKKSMTKDLCLKYSGNGKKGKKNFTDLKLRKAVVVKLQKLPCISN
jgi:hypothetical protein